MKFLLVAGISLALSGCAEINDMTAGLAGGSPGNPDGMPYAGAPDSVYPAAANPPRTIGTVTYNPPGVDTLPAAIAPPQGTPTLAPVPR